MYVSISVYRVICEYIQYDTDSIQLIGLVYTYNICIHIMHTYYTIQYTLDIPSNMSKGARLGMNNTARNSSCPSTEKCFTAKCSSQSLDKAL